MRRTASSVLLLTLLAAAAAPSTRQQAPDPRGPVDFDRDVLPVLGAQCLGCHSGPHPKGRLDLLSRANALAGGSSGEPSVVPGDVVESRLIAVVDGTDGELAMPPRGAPLAPAEVDVLRRWIAEGAPWSPAAGALSGKPWHWAYRAPRAATPPAVHDAAWRANPIDAFVLARLEREGLEHAPEAPPATLARRLALALTGLVPEPEEVDAFLAAVAEHGADAAVDGFVDSLLASPHYGERMARMWLDLARYADTNGYEKDDRRSMWPWRDWVIEAFNGNLPYDRFVLEQMAGDLLPDATLDTRIATGFHRNTMINEEGGTDPEEFRVEAVHDRVHTTASAFLGTTLSCARCHDHKFDPFTLADYYGFFAFFDGDRPDATVLSPTEQRASGAEVRVAPREEREAYAEALARRDAALAESARPAPELESARAQWEARAASGGAVWTVLEATAASAESGATLERLSDGSYRVSGASADVDTYRFEFTLPEAGARALRLEVLPDESQSPPRVGRAGNGNFVLSEFAAVCVAADRVRGGPLAFANAFADFEQQGGGERWLAAHAIDGQPKTGWAVGPESDRAHEFVAWTAEPFATGPHAVLKLTLAQRYGSAHTLARLRLSVAGSPDDALLAPLGRELRAALGKPDAERTPAERERLAAHYRAHAPALAAARGRLAAAEQDLARIATSTSLVMEKSAVPRTTRVHRKGNFLDQGTEVRPDLPAVFGALPEGLARDRLGLARWLASPQNPLFARVFVNHLWTLDFGRGLVGTPDDFGTQGDPPSHPELLDWLAVRFVEEDFDVRALQRLIVTSRTFRQDSRLDDAALERDPANVLYARGPRYRLEAEALRDVALAASGLLDTRLGGPSVFPPQPPGIWTMIYSSDQWVDSTGADRYRRGLYTFARRTAPYPTTALFDAPSRELACARRSRTNTPLQALALLNDPQFVECAVALARRMQREGGGTLEGAVGRGFRLCVARAPEPEEARTLAELLRSRLEHFAAEPEAAAALLANGHGTPPPGEDAALVAALAVVANVLLNLDETASLE